MKGSLKDSKPSWPRCSAMAKRFLITLLAALTVGSGWLYGCSCAGLSLCERLDKTQVIFLGEVIEGGVEPGQNPWRSIPGIARLRVVEAFRGLPKDAREVDIDLFFWSGMCSPNPYERGKQVLVFTHFDKERGILADGMCTQSLSHKWLGEDIGRVREYFRGEMKTEIYGRIAPNTNDSSVGYRLDSGDTPPIVGATVVVEGMGKRFRALSDSAGRYFVKGLPGGLYRLRAELAGYDNRGVEPEVSVKQGGCAVQNFGLWTKNSVEGFVFDPNGAPVRNIRVHLQRKGSTEKFGREARTDVRGGFRLNQLDPGEYTAVISPLGATAASPYPRTVLANQLTLGPTSTVDDLVLKLPLPIRTREIRIRTVDRDGSPLHEGDLTCAQAGKEDEGYPMSRGLNVTPDGAVCRALADRAYRIRLLRVGNYQAPELPNPPEALVPPGLETAEVILKAP